MSRRRQAIKAAVADRVKIEHEGIESKIIVDGRERCRVPRREATNARDSLIDTLTSVAMQTEHHERREREAAQTAAAAADQERTRMDSFFGGTDS